MLYRRGVALQCVVCHQSRKSWTWRRRRGARLDGRAGARSGAARQEQRRPAPDLLYIVGLGLWDKNDIQVKGLEAVHGAV
jgi:hypothetical protein